MNTTTAAAKSAFDVARTAYVVAMYAASAAEHAAQLRVNAGEIDDSEADRGLDEIRAAEGAAELEMQVAKARYERALRAEEAAQAREATGAEWTLLDYVD